MANHSGVVALFPGKAGPKLKNCFTFDGIAHYFQPRTWNMSGDYPSNGTFGQADPMRKVDRFDVTRVAAEMEGNRHLKRETARV